MNAQELLTITQKGESSKVQFKERLPNIDSLTHELIAFSNTQGGLLIIGVNDKTGELNGLSFVEIQQTNQQIINAASQKIYPPIFVTTETITVDGNNIIAVSIEEGTGKPYKDKDGIIYLKNGADKRKVTSNDEIARLLRSGGSLYTEEIIVNGSSTQDIDPDQFDRFLYRKYQESLDDIQKEKTGIDQLLENMGMAKNGVFLLNGLLLFSKKRHLLRPQFSVHCVSVDGSIIGNTFLDNEGAFEGTLPDVFQKTLDFIGRNMRKIPEGSGFNSVTKWEIPHEVFEELMVNALVHRDYFISSTIKVFMYTDKVEIISPGRLPNSLTINNIKNGVSVARNPILLSAAQYVLPYKGLGTGIRRAFSLYPDIIMENETDENQFKVIVKRHNYSRNDYAQ
jgi:predicted HTH transcriptional regulator